MTEQQALARQSSAAPCPTAVLATRGHRRLRSLFLLPVAALLVLGSSLAAAPAASAAHGQALQPYTGPVTRTGKGTQPAPKGPSGTQPARQAIPLRTPDPAALRRAKEAAASRVSGGGGRSPQAVSPLPKAAVFGGLNKAGMSAAQIGGGFTPPDTTGAIGPSHYLEFVNGVGITAYDRELNAVSGPESLEDFIGFPSDSVFDPQIQWDPSWGRWIYAMDDIESPTANFLAFGWSKTADPTNLTAEFPGEGAGAGWCEYFIATGEEFDDYPKLGHSSSGITIGTNVFETGFEGSRLWSIAKPPSPQTCPVLGVGSVASAFPLLTEDGDLAFTPVPANTADGSGDSYVVAADAPFISGDAQINGWHITGAGTGALLVDDGNMSVSPFAVPANVPQPGTSEVIDSNDTRLTNAVAVSDPAVGEEAVWTQHTVNGPGGRSEVRWYELLPSTQTVRQQGTISDPTQFVFNGAISPTAQGNAAAIDFNRGSSTLFPDMHAQSRDASTPLGQMAKDVPLGTSAGPAVDFSCDISEGDPCRWGDYGGASPDPSLPGIVWGSNQGLAAPIGEQARWTTRNFALFADVTAPAAPTISATDPASPASNTSPKVQGSAEAGSTVRIYTSTDCSGPVSTEGSAASFGSPGLTVSVADNATTQLSATATDDAGNTSSCSNSISYTESTPPPPPGHFSTLLPGVAVAKKLALVRRGKALLRVTCRGAGPCQGSLRLVYGKKVRKHRGKGKGKHSRRRVRNIVIGRSRFSIPLGQTRVVRVRLNRKGQRFVRHAGRHGLKVKLRGSGIANRTLRLKQKMKKHNRRHRRLKG